MRWLVRIVIDISESSSIQNISSFSCRSFDHHYSYYDMIANNIVCICIDRYTSQSYLIVRRQSLAVASTICKTHFKMKTMDIIQHYDVLRERERDEIDIRRFICFPIASVTLKWCIFMHHAWCLCSLCPNAVTSQYIFTLYVHNLCNSQCIHISFIKYTPQQR